MVRNQRLPQQLRKHLSLAAMEIGGSWPKPRYMHSVQLKACLHHRQPYFTHFCLQMIINGIMKVESLSFDRIKSVVLGKWISKYDRFSSVLVKSGFSYYFKALGQHFNPDDHVFRVGQGTIWDQEKLRSYMEEETAKPLDPGKPLWQIHVIENYKEGTNDACTVMFVRIHHVLADGIALVRLLLEVLADSHPKKEIADQTHKKKSQFGVSTTEWLIRGAILSPFYFIFHYISPPDRSNLHGPALSGKRTISWIHGLSMKDTLAMKETISKICGRKITLNDLLVGILGEAMLRYLRNHGCEKASENFPSQMKASVPVNLRPGNSKLEVNNKFAILFPELVLSLRNRYKVTGVGSIDNILSTHRHFDFLKHSGLPMAAQVLLESLIVSFVMPTLVIILYSNGICMVLQAGQPMSVVNFVTDTYSSKCSAVLSNVPGPQEKLTLDGAEVRVSMITLLCKMKTIFHPLYRQVKNVMFWAPGRYNIGLALSVFTYTTEVHFGVTADMALVSDASLVTASIREEFNQTLADIKGTFPETFAEAERIASSKTS